MTVTRATTKRRHGTPSGARLHSELGEPACDACAKAKADYDQHYRASKPVHRERARLNARAQQRTYGRLARRHPVEYWALYLAAKADLERERRP